MNRVLLTVILCSACCAAFGAAESDAPDTSAAAQAPAIPVVRGSLNPAKHGIGRLPPNPKVMIIPINDESTTKEGMIDEWQAGFVERRLRRAKDEKFNLVILEIDTNGGEIAACERINRAIAACGVPVVSFVKGKAFSGGALVSLGCKAIVMAPGTQIGGAKAVALGYTIDKDMRQKLDSMMNAMVKNLCDANHYPLAIAQGMVDSSIEVLETNDPLQRFMTSTEFDEMKVKPEILHKWKGKDQILTLSAREAVNTGLAAGTAADTDEVMLGFAATQASVEYADITTAEKVARFLSHPIWRVLIVIAGVIGLFLELKSPGHGAGYLAFALCMGVFFWLQIFAANAGLFELLLFGAGAVLVAVEIFVLPTIGALAVVGFGMLLASIVLSFLPEGLLSSFLSGTAKPWELDVLNTGLIWSAVTLISIVVIMVVGLLKGATLPGLSRLALKAQVNATVGGSGGGALAVSAPLPGRANLEALIGQTGATETVLRPAGKVRLNGITYEAVSEGGFLKPGIGVVVLRISPTGLVVRETRNG